jgi:hypothetical protein
MFHPEALVFVYLDTLIFFFGLDLKRRDNFQFVLTVTVRNSKKIIMMEKTHIIR